MKSFLLMLGLFIGLHAHVYEALHYESRFDVAREKALKADKLIMLLMIQKSCPWCHKMARDTLQDLRVKKEITKAFIPLILDADQTPAIYANTPKPTIFFINPHEAEVWRSTGYKNVEAFLIECAKARESYALDLAESEE